ncbi:MAG: PIN domain-containing protein [Steroidobacteraceae bacterium]
MTGPTGADRATRRLFVLDTNVLMHDPTSIFRFEEHDIYLPMVVLEELDATRRASRKPPAMFARPAASWTR